MVGPHGTLVASLGPFASDLIYQSGMNVVVLVSVYLLAHPSGSFEVDQKAMIFAPLLEGLDLLASFPLRLEEEHATN